MEKDKHKLVEVRRISARDGAVWRHKHADDVFSANSFSLNGHFRSRFFSPRENVRCSTRDWSADQTHLSNHEINKY